MSVKVKLEKNKFIKNGFVGFSWTTMFFGFWVPLFRLKLKDFFMFFIFFIVKVIAFYMFFKQYYSIFFEGFGIHYSVLTPITLLTVIGPIEIWIAYYYNKYYTDNLFVEGFYIMEDDEYSAAILKAYTYLPYNEDEITDSAKMERYLNISEQARKSERSKVATFFILTVIFYIILAIISLNTGNV